MPYLPDTQGSREEEVSLLQVDGGSYPLHSAHGEHDGGWKTLGTSLRRHLPLGGRGGLAGREGCRYGGCFEPGPITIAQHGSSQRPPLPTPDPALLEALAKRNEKPHLKQDEDKTEGQKVFHQGGPRQ